MEVWTRITCSFIFVPSKFTKIKFVSADVEAGR